MKKRMAVLIMACAAMAASHPGVVHAQVEVSASIQINSANDFYQPLGAYGSWEDVGSYGRCWHPRDVDSDWEPYTVGSWVWTDAGWYWQSDEPWGWACYHYGSWYDYPRVGWVWIPATDWAPAWVTWRSSDDYIGWAPCGPGRSVLAPSLFVFCDVHRFNNHFSRRDLVRNDVRIINRTRVINNFERRSVDFDGHQRSIYANIGPGVDPIRRATGAQFTARPIRDVVRESRRPDNVHQNEVQRPVQKPADQPRREAPAPTGRDQQRNYEQPRNSQQPEQQTPLRPKQPEQRIQPEQRAPETPQRRPDVIPPTGREEPRIYHQTPPQEVPKPMPAPEQRREIPTPPQRPVTPPERVLPPTGREEVPRAERREAAPPVRQAPTAPATPDGSHERDGNKDRNNP